MFAERDFSDAGRIDDLDKQFAAMGSEWDLEDEETLDLDELLKPFSQPS